VIPVSKPRRFLAQAFWYQSLSDNAQPTLRTAILPVAAYTIDGAKVRAERKFLRRLPAITPAIFKVVLDEVKP
jgi:hypothetical protein